MKFANSKKRIIQTSEKGKMYVNGAKGRQYNPKAAFKVLANGSMVKLTANNRAAVPSPIRPKSRATGPREGTLLRRMNTESRKLISKMGVARKTRSDKGVKRGPAGPRKPRSNKGVARGPREGTLLRRMNTESRKLMAKGPRKVRSNKGVARGPRPETLAKRAAAAKAKANKAAAKNSLKLGNLTPQEAVLYSLIFGSPRTQRKIKAANPQLKNPKRVKGGKKAAGTRSLKKFATGGRFNALM